MIEPVSFFFFFWRTYGNYGTHLIIIEFYQNVIVCVSRNCECQRHFWNICRTNEWKKIRSMIKVFIKIEHLDWCFRLKLHWSYCVSVCTYMFKNEINSIKSLCRCNFFLLSFVEIIKFLLRKNCYHIIFGLPYKHSRWKKRQKYIQLKKKKFINNFVTVAL